jgi:hypothetical protein
MAINGQTNLGIGDSEQIQEWLSGVTYQPSEEVSHDFNVYICLVCHVSGDFATDLGSAYWFLVGGVGAVETDPIFTASPAAGITSGDITNWDTAFGWGDHSTAGYLLAASATWATILATGAESGANNPIINDGQHIGFRSGAFTNTLDTRTLTAGHTQSLQDRDGILAHTDQIPNVSDVAYAASWNGNSDAATKNAIYDKIESLSFDQTLAETLGFGNTTGSNDIIVSALVAAPRTFNTGTTAVQKAQIIFTNAADLTGAQDEITIASGQTGSKANPNSNITVNGSYAELNWRDYSSYVYAYDSGLILASEDEITLFAKGVGNLNKLTVLDGTGGVNKFTLDFGAIGANYTATWQQASGTIAYLSDIGVTDNVYTADGVLSGSRTVTANALSFTIDGTAGDFAFNGSSGNASVTNLFTAARYNASIGTGNGFRFNGFIDHNIHMTGTGNMFMTVDGNDLFRLHNVGGFRGVSVNTGGAIPTATVDAQSGDNLSTSRILRARNFAGLDAFVVYGNGRIGINTTLAPTDLMMIESGGTNNRGLTVKNGTDIAASIGYTTASGAGGYLSLRDTNNAQRVLIKGGTTAGSAVFGINDGDYLFGIMTGTTPTAPFDARVNTALFRSASSGQATTFRGTGGQVKVSLDANGGATSDSILTWQKGGVDKYSAKYDASGDVFLIGTGLAGNTGISITSSNDIGFGGLNVNGSQVEVTGDVEVKGSTNGLILESPDNSRWRVTIDNAGALSSASI